MTIQAAPELIAGYLLVLVRASAWIIVCPPFNTRLIPTRVKIAFAFALSLAVGSRGFPEEIPLDTVGYLGAVLGQVTIGLVLGFIALLLFSAVQAAGALIDLFGGFTIDSAYDPLSNAQASVFGRFYQLLAITMLFVIDGHLLLVRGFMKSFEAIGPGALDMGALSKLLSEDFSKFFTAALEISGPIVAAMFIAEVTLGLVSRAAPQLNVLQLGFPLKILLTLMLIGSALALLPDNLQGLVDSVLKSWSAVPKIFGG
jgi:flagellar biosynthesis protein FliR